MVCDVLCWCARATVVGVLCALITSPPPSAEATVSRPDRSPPGVEQEYCLTDKFNAVCAEDEVIMMQSSMYGRMKMGKCVKTDFGYVGCGKDVIHITDARCSGRRRCLIPVPDPMLEAVRVCNEEFKVYLSTNYTCIPVATAHPRLCRPHNDLKLKTTSGYIANTVTDDTGCGGKNIPWVIEVPPGQRINLTLIDFSSASPPPSDPELSPIQTCRPIATISEEGGAPRRVCARGHRISGAYLSSSNQVKVEITKNDRNQEPRRYFLLQYEAIGCPDPPHPVDGFMTREGDQAAFGCHEVPNKSWRWICMKGIWQGPKTNCTPDEVVLPSEQVGLGILALPLSTAVILIIGVAVGVSVVILAIGLVAIKGPYKRRRRSTPSEEAEHQNILLKSPPVGSGFKIEYCTPVIDGSTDHVCAATLTRQQRPSLNMTDVDYGYRWEEPSAICATRQLDKSAAGPTYCTAPIKLSHNDYAVWSGGGTSGGANPLLTSDDQIADGPHHHEGCAELSSGQELSKAANHCLPSGSEVFHLDLGCGPCSTYATGGGLHHANEELVGTAIECGSGGGSSGGILDCSGGLDHHDDSSTSQQAQQPQPLRFERRLMGSSDLCKVEEEVDSCDENDVLCKEGRADRQNQLNSMLQNITSPAAT